MATANEDGKVVPQLRNIAFAAEATLTDAGQDQVRTIVASLLGLIERKSVTSKRFALTTRCENVGLPSSPSRADRESVVVALCVCLAVAEASAALVYLVRRQLDRRRYVEWDREINASHDNGRSNHQS
jgi:hypothetical protein